MGCGASKDPKIGVADSTKPISNSQASKNNSTQNRNGFKQVELKNASDSYNYKNDPRQLPDVKNNQPLAFVIQFDENKKSGNLNRPPPGRLQLEPLKTNPNAMQEKLDEKMRAVERNREQILASRAKSSKKRSSAGRRENDSNDSSYVDQSMHRRDSYSNDYSKQNGFNGHRSNSGNGIRNGGDDLDNEKRERLLKARRIVAQPNRYEDDDDDIEHDKNYNRNDEDFYNRRRN